LPGVTLSVPENPIGTATDIDGKYAIQVPEGSTLVFSLLGFESQTIAVGGRSVIDVTLAADMASLDEIVVVGYGIQKKANLTGAVDEVTSEDFQNRPIPNVAQRLVGAVPNLNIRMLDGKPTQSPSFNIRGTTSIGQQGSALVLIDGVEGDPRMLNPNDIESISVLKDASSASIY